ncbi:Acg family FMN-binding oxidoreductase [Streptomyces aquilus]|uniref:Acg family FMN-binding oxidoreductase n=1 Tax=Streptomyces aquilus TaxID=2548456 RepID=UPI0037D6F8C9
MSLTYEASAPPEHALLGRAAFHLARAATRAPSLHNTQPWFFVDEGRDHGFEVHADGGRRLPLTDPAGRELVISCGAALFNVRVAVRNLGFRPVVTPLPVPAQPAFLAHVAWGAHAVATTRAKEMERALSRRHTHRGLFAPTPVSWSLMEELRDQARAEGALLHTVDNPEKLRMLAQWVRAAESVHRADPGHASEVSGWSGHARRDWWERVSPDACRLPPDGSLLAGRDYTGLVGQCEGRARRWTARTGTVVVLSTPHDTRLDWLRAGQALQRVLLYAASHDVTAAFHTQPLELPELRPELQARLTGDRFPQMILRLGHTTQVSASPRRPAAAVLHASRSGPVATVSAPAS